MNSQYRINATRYENKNSDVTPGDLIYALFDIPLSLVIRRALVRFINEFILTVELSNCGASSRILRTSTPIGFVACIYTVGNSVSSNLFYNFSTWQTNCVFKKFPQMLWNTTPKVYFYRYKLPFLHIPISELMWWVDSYIPRFSLHKVVVLNLNSKQIKLI